MRRIRAFSMIGTLIAVAIVAILVAVFLSGGLNFTGEDHPRPDKVGKTIIGQSAARARDAVCMEHLGQLRAAIELASQTADTLPQSLDEVSISEDFKHCPIEPREKYVYDAETGKVKCPHPGHEKY